MAKIIILIFLLLLSSNLNAAQCDDISFYEISQYQNTAITKYVFTDKFKNNAYWSNRALMHDINLFCPPHNSFDQFVLDEAYKDSAISTIKSAAYSFGDVLIKQTPLKNMVEFDIASPIRNSQKLNPDGTVGLNEVNKNFSYYWASTYGTLGALLGDSELKGRLLIGERVGLSIFSGPNYFESSYSISSNTPAFTYGHNLEYKELKLGFISATYYLPNLNNDSRYIFLRYGLVF